MNTPQTKYPYLLRSKRVRDFIVYVILPLSAGLLVLTAIDLLWAGGSPRTWQKVVRNGVLIGIIDCTYWFKNILRDLYKKANNKTK